MSRPTYEELLLRVEQLEKENQELRIRCGMEAKPYLNTQSLKTELIKLSPEEKISIFRGLFRGREDIFAQRWYNKTSNKSGYQPVCANNRGALCNMQKHKCSECPNRKFEPLNYQCIYNHLAGKDANGRDVIGLYAILQDNTCYFLCADFDDKNCEHDYKNDVLAFVNICNEWQIPVAIERSRSGNGAHVWIFFNEAISAIKARRLGNTILNEAMNRSDKMSFKSYDRFIPNQDQLPIGGFGNLIALPLQGLARKKGNSVFVNSDFEPYFDQWAYLKSINKINITAIDKIIQDHYKPIQLAKTSENKPWETPTNEDLNKSDLPNKISIVRADSLYIPTSEISAKVTSYLRRLATFHNPEFYSKKALRFSTYATPRIISCAEVDDNYIALPRGCEDAVIKMLSDHGVIYAIDDKTNSGTSITVELNMELYDNQSEAVAALSRHNNGILCATTGFGKTIAAIGLIAKLKTNTLILVHNKALQTQWIEKLSNFLTISYSEPEQAKCRGRKKKFSPIGSGSNMHGIIDVATFQSCITNNEIRDFVNNYGLVIVDECHHVSATSFEQVLKSIRAKYIYGLTATPIRKDGLQPIIFMQCGPIRYKFDSKAQIADQSFKRLLISRFTSYRCLAKTASYTALRQDIADDAIRNEQIVNDVKAALMDGRTPIIITTLRSHVARLSELLKPYVTHIIELVGSKSDKEKRLALNHLNNIPKAEQLVIIATGQYIGEGFDYPRLDTLFLAMPVSWKGIIAQYAGRLHRNYEGKDDVRIYDYVDIHNLVCEKMYRRRLKGYASIGYKTYLPSTSLFDDNAGTIFDGHTFIAPFLESLNSATKSVLICAPQIKFSSTNKIVHKLTTLLHNGVSLAIFTNTPTPQTKFIEQLGAEIHISNSQLYCAIIDKATTWYGSINYLGYNSTEQNAIKINNNSLATDFLTSIYDTISH